MSILFSPKKIGNLEIKNRFVHSGTGECMATEDGKVTEKLIKRYKTLSRGEVGLIVTGYMSVHRLGRGMHHQTGIHSDRFIPGLEKLAEGIHENGGKVLFQLVHAGRQTTPKIIGQNPKGPSAIHRDPTYLIKPGQLTTSEIHDIIISYKKCARRAMTAGADGIHISAAGGYLINQFLSPYHNRRKDDWGGSTKKRFKLLKEIVLSIKSVLPSGTPLIIKISTDDKTPGPGVELNEAMKHAKWLADIGVEGIEVASGNLLYNHMTMWHGQVPTKEIVRGLPGWQKPIAWLKMKYMEGKFDLKGPWNLPAAKSIRSVIGDIPLFLVGGLRDTAEMTALIENRHTDFIQMCRPFIREPSLVKKIREGKTEKAACINCNRCFGAIVNSMPIACYHKGLPEAVP